MVDSLAPRLLPLHVCTGGSLGTRLGGGGMSAFVSSQLSLNVKEPILNKNGVYCVRTLSNEKLP